MTSGQVSPVICIVGAGISSLMAAKELLEKCPNATLVIYEAQSRFGGRLHTTCEDDGSRMENGAAWIHGEYRHHEDGENCQVLNPMLELADEFGIERVATPDMACVRSNGSCPDVTGVLCLFEKVWNIIGHLEKDSEICNIANGSTEDKNAMAFICSSDAFREALQIEAAEHEYETIISVFIEFQNNYGATYDKMSAGAWAIMKEYIGSHYLLKCGYSNFVDLFIAKYGLSKVIRLEHRVQAVEMIDDDHFKYKVTVQNAALPAQEFLKCNYVVMAVPLGVLKANSIRFGENVITSAARETISKMGSGKFEKVFIDFDDKVETFWPPQSCNYIMITPDHSGKVDEILRRPQREVDDSVCDDGFEEVGMEVVNLEAIYGVPRIVALFYDKHAERVAALSVREDWESLKAFVEPLIRRAFLRECSVNINRVRGTSWSLNPDFLCSFSYIPTGCNVSHLQALTKLNDGFVFAGEHASPHFLSTVHGAIESGVNAANVIAQDINAHETKDMAKY